MLLALSSYSASVYYTHMHAYIHTYIHIYIFYVIVGEPPLAAKEARRSSRYASWNNASRGGLDYTKLFEGCTCILRLYINAVASWFLMMNLTHCNHSCCYITWSRIGWQSSERVEEARWQADAHRDSSDRGAHLPCAPEYSKMYIFSYYEFVYWDTLVVSTYWRKNEINFS